MSTLPFRARSETFGLDTSDPWGLEVARLLFNVPRTFGPLVDAIDARSPGMRRNLERLADLGFVAYQPPVIVDTRTGVTTDTPTRAVTRYRATSRARRLLEKARTDLRVLEDAFPRATRANLAVVHRLLKVLFLDDANARFGLSAEAAIAEAGFTSDRTGRWWLKHLIDKRYVRVLDHKLADVREVVPEHFRPTREFSRQLLDIIDAFDGVPESLATELRLKRSRFLDDIDPARVGLGGATDFDHDIEAQKVIASMLISPRARRDGIFQIEPRFALPLDASQRLPAFDAGCDQVALYQPDAELREHHDGTVRRSVVEYERFQSRRDAWGHVERFLGWLHTTAFPFEAAVLRFVVDTPARARTYVELIEAFCDYAIDHPERMPANPVLLTVSTVDRLLHATDPLDDAIWHRLALPAGAPSGGLRTPVLHPADDSPYDDYFGRR